MRLIPVLTAIRRAVPLVVGGLLYLWLFALILFS